MTLFLSGCTSVQKHEIGYEFYKLGDNKGEVRKLKSSGNYWFYNFLYRSIYTIDTRPHQIRIEGNNRVLNAKLVKFREEGLDQFISLHGVGDYGYDGGTNDLGEILKGYAYEGIGSKNYDEKKLQEKYKFLEIKSSTAAVDDPVFSVIDTSAHH